MYRFIFFVLLSVLFTVSNGHLTAQVRDLGEITVRSDVKVIPVTISSDMAGIKRQAEMAFSANGRY